MSIPGVRRRGLSRPEVEAAVGHGAVFSKIQPGIYRDVSDAFAVGAPSGVQLGGNVIYTMLFPLPDEAQPIDRIGLVVTATGTATAARLGAFKVDDYRVPTDLIEEYGTVDLSTTGDKELVLAAKSLPSGPFAALGFVMNGTCTVHLFASPLQNAYGYPSLSSTTRRASATKTHAYGPLPASFGVPTTYLQTFPRISVRGA